ncbi:hypothetical protein ACR70V_17090 [Klebsiella pneumoniae]|uniref:hypothetical protein n=1 Tax=Enterobacteriaceae TaxID=543 RepID=UPI00075F6CAF|nr:MULTISPECIES: hypothetical protein [Enterobacteriaceae]KVI98173.1 hypothetical protein AWS42_15960 [Enterobacter hormaechei subsp. hoffmannii]MCZ3435878.1 hypothetical protein [Klebsiella pneumoniae]MDE4669771.1 hypothetical protein [Klebsiella pneumoniae]CAF2449818.1 hypothetical protein AI2844V1_1850 [Klebsiella pneumoniae]CAH5182327.1 hypothetical protein AI2844V1_1850 [Klebsiella pneumoniae]
MTTLNKAVSINQPIASINHLLPYEQRQHIERLYFPKVQQATDRMNKAESEYQDAVESRSVLINQKAAEYLANPSERHGFIVKQVYPTNQQQVIRSMAEQGYMVHRVSVGMVTFIRMPKNAKDNPLQEITDKATAEAESTIDKMIERLKVKTVEAVHQRNKIVIEARKALDSIKSFENYLNVIVTESEEVTE